MFNDIDLVQTEKFRNLFMHNKRTRPTYSSNRQCKHFQAGRNPLLRQRKANNFPQLCIKKKVSLTAFFPPLRRWLFLPYFALERVIVAAGARNKINEAFAALTRTRSAVAD